MLSAPGSDILTTQPGGGYDFTSGSSMAAAHVSGIVALLFSWGGETSMAASVFANGGPLVWAIILSPLAIVFAMSFGQNKFSTGTLQVLFWSFTVLMGLSLSTLLLRYSGESVAQAFFAAAAGFAGLSLYGYTTKKDLSGLGSFLIVGSACDDKVLVQRTPGLRPEVMSKVAFEELWDGRLVLMTRRATLSDLSRRFDITWFLGALQMFTQSYVMTRGGPVNATKTLVYIMYEQAFSALNIGKASAIAVLLFGAVVFLSLLLRLLGAARQRVA